MQTKPHYAGGFISGNPSINIGTQLHELAHQWVGNSVTLAAWDDIWFNEGWANWAEWYWQFAQNGGDDPALIFDDLYATTPAERLGDRPGRARRRPRQHVRRSSHLRPGGDDAAGLPGDRRRRRVLRLAKALQRRFAYGNISTAEFIDVAMAPFGLRGAELTLLHRLLPAVALRRDEADDPPGVVRPVVPAERSAGWRPARSALLLTDVEASTRLLVRHGQSGVVALGRVSAVVSAAASEHGGEVSRAQGEGDSAVVLFTSVGAAVAAALDVNERLAAEHWPAGDRVVVRSAVHVGEVTATDEGLFGLEVHRCARLAAASGGWRRGAACRTPRRVRSRRNFPSEHPSGTRASFCCAGFAQSERVWRLVHPALRAASPPTRRCE